MWQPRGSGGKIHNKTDDTESDSNLNCLYSQKTVGARREGAKVNEKGSSSWAVAFILVTHRGLCYPVGRAEREQ